MAPPYAITFVGDLEEQILQDCSFQPLMWCGGDTLMISFLLWQHGEKIKRILGYS